MRQTNFDVGENPLPGQQPRLLEHQPHGVPPALGLAVDHDGARSRLIQPGDQAQQRAFAAAAAPDDGHELSRPDVEVDPAQHALRAERLA